MVASIVAVTTASSAAPLVQRVTGTAERVVHPQGPCRGGVAVTREELAELQARTERVVLANATFTVFAGDKHVGKPLTRFKTDRSGRFEVSLAAGVFCIMAGEHRAVPRENSAGPAAAPRPHVDAECLRERALACDAVLHVRKDSTRDVKVRLDTYTPCPQPWAQPCYRGPMPP